MKNQKNNLFLICLMLFLVLGCNNFDFLSSKSDAEKPSLEELKKKREERRNKDEEAREPKALTAKMLNNFPVPADAEVVSDEKSEREILGTTRLIKLRSSETVYDISHFFRQEMEKNSWTDNQKNDNRKENPRSFSSSLTFSNETEEASVRIREERDKGSETEITIREKLENKVPIPECANQSNRLSDENSLTINGDCAENIASVVKFYNAEFPKKGWKPANQTGNPDSDETVVISFTKEDQKAVVTLAANNKNSTSINVRISK